MKVPLLPLSRLLCVPEEFVIEVRKVVGKPLREGHVGLLIEVTQAIIEDQNALGEDDDEIVGAGFT